MSASAPVSIVGAGVVSAAGRGRPRLFEALLRAVPLGNPTCRYSREGLETTHTARVPDAIWHELANQHPGRPRAVQLAHAAIEEALAGRSLAPSTGLFVGTSLGCIEPWEEWHCAYVAHGHTQPMPRHHDHADVAWALADDLSLDGPVVTVSTACTSSAAALMQAADAIRAGELDRALVVGVDVVGRFVHAGFDRLAALSPDGQVPAPFASERAGMWLGEAAAAMVISREGVACGRFLGGGTAGDGVHMTAPDRFGGGAYRACVRALAEAGLSPAQIGWVSAHATGTRFNDGMEAAALRRVFDGSIPPVHAAKPVLGHTLGASGLLEAVIGLEVLSRRVRPPTPRAGTHDPALADVPLDAAAQPFVGDAVLSLNSALAGHNSALVLGAA